MAQQSGNTSSGKFIRPFQYPKTRSAKMIKLSQTGHYLFEINLDRNERETSTPAPIETRTPSPNMRLKLEIVSGPNKGHKFQGVFIEDPLGRYRDMYACAHLCKSLYQPVRPGATVDVRMEVIDDGRSRSRQNAAMDQLQRGSDDHTQGLDLQEIFPENPRKMKNVGSLAQELKGVTEARATFDSILDRYGLDTEQRRAAEHSFTSDSGLTIVSGPPGTGKTYVQMAAVEGHVCVGDLSGVRKRQILVTAPSDAVVDRSLKMLAVNLGSAHRPIEICRFRGGQFSTYMSQVSTENETVQQELISREQGEQPADAADVDENYNVYAVWDCFDQTTKNNKCLGADVLPQYEFAYQRNSFLENLAGDINSPLSKNAGLLLRAKRKLNVATGEIKQKLKRLIDRLEADLNQRYFDQVDVIFVSNDSAIHPILTRHFKPTMWFSEDVTSVPGIDQAIAATAFADTIEYWWATGDHEQQIIDSPLQDSYEAYGKLARPFFQTLYLNTSWGNKVQLFEQHRMKPAISDFISRLWYEGKLKSHASQSVVSELEEAIIEAYQPLGKHGSSSSKLMVDGSSPAQARYGFRTAIVNLGEADSLLNHVQYLLQSVPKQDSEGSPRRRIQHEDIMIVTECGGQARYISSELRTRGINVAARGELKAKEIRVLEASAVHGCEAPIVLHSIVHNYQEAPLFMERSQDVQNFRLSLSRAQILHVTFGPIRRLVRAMINKDRAFESDRVLFPLGPILNEYHEKGDIISEEHLARLHNKQRLEDKDAFGNKVREVTGVSGQPYVPGTPEPSDPEVLFADAFRQLEEERGMW